MVDERILVAAPTHESKSYCIDEYLFAYDAFRYKDKYLVFCDNTGGDKPGWRSEIRDKLPKGADILQSCKSDDILHTVNMAWIEILKYARGVGYPYIMSIESDVICPPGTLDFMFGVMRDFDAAVVGHSVPHTDRKKDFMTTALGCTLMKTDAVGYPEPGFPAFEGTVYNVPRSRGDKIVLLDNFLDIKHLDSGHYGYQ
jgi:hypothetical protein